MRALRAAVTAAAYGAAAGLPPAATDVAAINAAAAHPPFVPLQLDGTATIAPASVPPALSTLAPDAIDLFGGSPAGRIRVCAGENCGLLFVDASRPGKRRWCCMERCGNLAKVRHHRARTPAGPP